MTLFNKHQHQWVEVSRKFNRPSPNVDVLRKPIYQELLDLAKALALGQTVVELRCLDCGEIKAVTYYGDAGTKESSLAVVERIRTEVQKLAQQVVDRREVATPGSVDWHSLAAGVDAYGNVLRVIEQEVAKS